MTNVDLTSTPTGRVEVDFNSLNLDTPDVDMSSLNFDDIEVDVSSLNLGGSPEQSTYDAVTGAAQTVANGATLGAQDELAGFFRTFTDAVTPKTEGEKLLFADGDVMDRPGSFLQKFQENFVMFADDSRRNQKEFANNNPALALGLEIAGGIGTGTATAKLAANMLAKGSSAAKIGLVSGAVDGGVYGFLDSGDGLAGRFRDGVIGATVGGAFGGGAGKAVDAFTARKANRAVSDGNAILERVRENYAIARNKHGMDHKQANISAAAQAGVTDDDVRMAMHLTGEDMKLNKYMHLDADELGTIENARKQGTQSPSVWLESAKRGVDTLDKYGGAMSTRLEAVSPRLWNEMRGFERKVLTNTSKYMKRAHQFETHYKAAPQSVQNNVSKAMFNNDYRTALDAAKDYPALRSTIKDMRKMVDEVGSELNGVGYIVNQDANYFPRKVKDLKGLRTQLGRDPSESAMDRALIKENKKLGRALTAVEEEKVRTRVLKSQQRGAGGLPNLEQRTVDFVSQDMIPYYADPVEAISTYVHKAVQDVEMKRLFNQNASGSSLSRMWARELRDTDPLLAGKSLDEVEEGMLDQAVAKVVMREGLQGEQAQVVEAVMKARFGGGRQGMSKGWSRVKDVGVVTALGNIPSTIIQFGDTANALYKSGIRNGTASVIESIQHSLTGKRIPIDLEDLGVDNRITADLNHADGMHKWVDKTLELTQFKRMDRFGKRAVVLAANRKLSQDAKKGGALLRKKYGQAFPDIDVVIEDFRAGRMTDDVKNVLFHELSDVQPITMMEMPEAFAANPKLRLAYSLKSYALKQLDIMRKDIWNETKKGNYAKAATNTGRFLLLTTMINGSVDEMRNFIRGDELRPEDIPQNMVDHLTSLSIIGNRYTRDRYFARGEVGDGLLSVVAPPAVGAANKVFQGNVSWVPLVGQLIEDHARGGSTKRRERADKRRYEGSGY